MKVVVGLLTVLGLAILLAMIMALPTMWLWNYIMPDIFGLIEINFYQALAMNVLSSVLFKANTSTNNKNN
jgi:hypothetical protein